MERGGKNKAAPSDKVEEDLKKIETENQALKDQVEKLSKTVEESQKPIPPAGKLGKYLNGRAAQAAASSDQQ